MGFIKAYDWMAAQMRARIGTPPEGVDYPIWAWHTIDFKHKKPDLRRREFRYPSDTDRACIELEIPDSGILLSDEMAWYAVLNDSYLDENSNEAEWEKSDRWFNELSDTDKDHVKQQSWNRIFITSPPLDTPWRSIGKYIQATFWEIKAEQIKDVRIISPSRRKSTPTLTMHKKARISDTLPSCGLLHILSL